MYLLVRFGGHKSNRNGDINSYINSYRENVEKVKIMVLIHHIGRFLIRNTDLFRYGWQKIEKNEKKNLGNCKDLCISRKHKKQWQKQNFLGYRKNRIYFIIPTTLHWFVLLLLYQCCEYIYIYIIYIYI